MKSECDNYECINCADDDVYMVYCEICEELCIERFYKNHLKSGTYTHNFYERPRFCNTYENNEN